MEAGLVITSPKKSRAVLDLYEYLLVAYPDAAVNNRIIEEKQNFYNEYKQKVAVKTKPYITVAGFLAKDVMEETLIRYIQRICNGMRSFNVELNNYSGFPPHTIYLRVQNPEPFRQLAKELKAVSNYIDSCDCPPAKLITNPHVNISKRVPENFYLKAMMEYGQKSFHETFKLNELLLMRRKNEFDECVCINVFHLKPAIDLY